MSYALLYARLGEDPLELSIARGQGNFPQLIVELMQGYAEYCPPLQGPLAERLQKLMAKRMSPDASAKLYYAKIQSAYRYAIIAHATSMQRLAYAKVKLEITTSPEPWLLSVGGDRDNKTLVTPGMAKFLLAEWTDYFNEIYLLRSGDGCYAIYRQLPQTNNA